MCLLSVKIEMVVFWAGLNQRLRCMSDPKGTSSDFPMVFIYLKHSGWGYYLIEKYQRSVNVMVNDSFPG